MGKGVQVVCCGARPDAGTIGRDDRGRVSKWQHLQLCPGNGWGLSGSPHSPSIGSVYRGYSPGCTRILAEQRLTQINTGPLVLKRVQWPVRMCDSSVREMPDLHRST